VEGLFHLGPTQLYVNRGVGTVGIPMRFNCPPEIALITLI
jgi:predicted MPP superfamily phosphohydrolase